MPDVHEVLTTPRTHVHEVLTTPRVHEVLTTDTYPIWGVLQVPALLAQHVLRQP